MTKSQLMQAYRPMSAEDQRTFERWLRGNAIVGSIFAAALVAMAIMGSDAAGPNQAAAKGDQASELSSSHAHRLHITHTQR